MEIEYIKTNELIPYKNNPRINDQAVEKVAESIKNFGFKVPVIVDEENVLIAGHTRVKAAKALGMGKVPTIRANDLTDEQIRAFRIADNKTGEFAEWDFELLQSELEDLEDEFTGFDEGNIDQLMQEYEDQQNGDYTENEEYDYETEIVEGVSGSLVDNFLVPPFTVLDTKQGYWQDRKRLWLSLGIKSETGRDQDLTYGDSGIGQDPGYYNKKNEVEKKLGRVISHDEFKEKHYAGGTMSSTSVFDPVLCEIMYSWFNTEKGKILDCFAGGSVRGIVAGKLGFEYTGVDLSKNQINANIEQLETIKDINVPPTWHNGNSLNIKEIVGEDKKYDLLFSCPPYHCLEVYSDNPEDLSNMGYDEFMAAYEKIIERSVSLLKENRFAVFVVGDIRDKKGFYRNFVGDTTNAFVKAGMTLYNEAVLLTQNASAPLRAKRPFVVARKLTKTHQNILIFYKGDPKNIRDNFPEINIAETLQKAQEDTQKENSINDKESEDEYGELL